MKIGVLALQGAVARHRQVLEELGAATTAVRRPDDLRAVDGVVLPGGESTAMSHLLRSAGLHEPLAAALADGLPALGTCAGMILLAATILDGRDDQIPLDAIDIAVRRNAFGRQVDSFEAELDIAGLAGPFRGVFIRAPVVEEVRAGVDVLASVDGRPVLCSQGPVLVSAFHPELADDHRLHALYLDRITHGEGRS